MSLAPVISLLIRLSYTMKGTASACNTGLFTVSDCAKKKGIHLLLLFPPPLSVEDDEVILHWTEDGKNLKKSQRELAEGAKINQKDMKNLEYFRAQLELFAKMCLGRQYLAILKVKEQLPIDVVLK